MLGSFRDWVKSQARKLPAWSPNFLSLLRIVFAPAVPFSYYRWGLFWTIVTFVLLAITDLLDGWLARLLGAESELGKKLDALGDWVLAGSTATMLVFLGVIPSHVSDWQIWFLGLILTRAVSIVFAVVLQKEKTDRIHRPESAQQMSGFLAIALGLFLLSHAWASPFLKLAGEGALAVSTVYAFVSWWQYFRHFRKV